MKKIKYELKELLGLFVVVGIVLKVIGEVLIIIIRRKL